jgi:hypothetical protein
LDVTLAGTGSVDSDGSIVSYVWAENSVQIATGVNPVVSLAVGNHTIDLTVTDDSGASATDTVPTRCGTKSDTAGVPDNIDDKCHHRSGSGSARVSFYLR